MALRPGPRTLHLPLGRRTSTDAVGLAEAIAAALVACALAAAFGPWPAPVRAVLAMGLVFAAGAQHRAFTAKSRSFQPLHPRRAWLIVDDDGIRRVDCEKQSTLVDWREPFGVTVLASADRSTLVVALTSPREARYITAHVDDAYDASLAPNVIARATTAADSDLRVSDELGLSAANAERLLSEIAHRAPGAVDRAYLSDSAGEPVVFDRTELRVGARRIDLSAPLEWRAFIFQERGPSVLSLCQATWVRQGDAEVVLVAPIPADCAWIPEANAAVRDAGDESVVDRAVARDVRLMQAEVGEPPPRELRRAIDRLFMIPLRRVLDRAPRDARAPSSPSVTSVTVPVGRA